MELRWEPPDVCAAVCGDGVLAGGETCDDGNLEADDGCSAKCASEPGWTCTGAPSVCVTACGDGVVVGAEACDDGNTMAGDGCNATCDVEPAPAPSNGCGCGAGGGNPLLALLALLGLAGRIPRRDRLPGREPSTP